MQVLLFTVQLGLGILVPWAILRWDLSRLPADRLSRAWPDVSRWMAIVVFGPLALPFHFTKTRRSLWGLLLGLVWLVLALVAMGAISGVLGWLVGED